MTQSKATRSKNAPYAGDLRRDLMDAAIAVVAKEDPASLSLRAVARGVGVSHAAPKNHFSDKRDLLTAIAIEGFERLGHLFAYASSGTAPDALGRLGRAYIRFSLDHPGYFRVMWRNELLHADAPRLMSAGQEVFDVFVAEVARAQTRGFKPHHDTANLAMALWTSAHGLAQLHLDGPLGDMDPRQIDEVVDGVLAVLLDEVS